jgi:hypothetical protein
MIAVVAGYLTRSLAFEWRMDFSNSSLNVSCPLILISWDAPFTWELNPLGLNPEKYLVI